MKAKISKTSYAHPAGMFFTKNHGNEPFFNPSSNKLSLKIKPSVFFKKKEIRQKKEGAQKVRLHDLSHQPIVQRNPYLSNVELGRDYANEKGNKRPDLIGVLEDESKAIKRLHAVKLKLAQPEANNAEGLLAAKKLLLPGHYLLDPIIKKIEHLNLAETRNLINSAYTYHLEKARLQDVAIDDSGELDMEALKDRVIEYDESPASQNKSQISIDGGKLKRSDTHDTAPGETADTSQSVTQHTGKGWEIFVMSPAGKLHMASHKIGKYHHSSLLAGVAVAGAGTIKAADGDISEMNDKSGHYMPKREQTKQVCHMLKKNAVDLSKITLKLRDPAYEGKADKFLTQGDEYVLDNRGQEHIYQEPEEIGEYLQGNEYNVYEDIRGNQQGNEYNVYVGI